MTSVKAPDRRRGLMAVALVCLAVAGFAALNSGGPDGPIRARAIVLAGLSAMPVTYRLFSRTFDLFEPIQLISAIFALSFAGRAWFVVSDPVTYVRIGLYPYDDMLPTALNAAIAGFLALLAGYAIAGRALRSRRRPALEPWPDAPPLRRLGYLLAAGIAATGILVAMGHVVGGVFSTANVSAATFVVLAVSQFPQFTALICVSYLFHTRSSQRTALA